MTCSHASLLLSSLDIVAFPVTCNSCLRFQTAYLAMLASSMDFAFSAMRSVLSSEMALVEAVSLSHSSLVIKF